MTGPELLTLPDVNVGGLPVRLRRSIRRTVGLKVSEQGLTVYAPRQLDEARVRRFIEEKRGWAERHLQVFQQSQVRPPPLADGLRLCFAGEQLTLRSVPELKKAVRVGDELQAPAGELEQAVEAWYKSEALRHFQPLVEQYAACLTRGRALRGVRLTNAGRRWGSCTAAGVIRLHWRLLLAPPEVMHYVAAHEAAHLAELNHSPRYWAELEQLFPEYQAAERWLRQHGAALMSA